MRLDSFSQSWSRCLKAGWYPTSRSNCYGCAGHPCQVHFAPDSLLDRIIARLVEKFRPQHVIPRILREEGPGAAINDVIVIIRESAEKEGICDGKNRQSIKTMMKQCCGLNCVMSNPCVDVLEHNIANVRRPGGRGSGRGCGGGIGMSASSGLAVTTISGTLSLFGLVSKHSSQTSMETLSLVRFHRSLFRVLEVHRLLFVYFPIPSGHPTFPAARAFSSSSPVAQLCFAPVAILRTARLSVDPYGNDCIS